ncbi:MAG: hypothetical protein EA399_16415 [Desulfovibrionales bacterium]|nr:MAG: hypothetical protein EA399_16415 [Desulfovibrionales bacterium]
MNTSHITESLADLFQAEDRRIVFWHDPDGEFADFVRALGLDGVQVILADEVGSLELKVLLELEAPLGRYLLYFRSPEPEPDQDWLLDIRLYAKTFHADWASILLGELGLINQSMRGHLQERKSFFSSKDRLVRAKKLIAPHDREAELDLKLLAVLTRAEHPGSFEVLIRLFGQMCPDRKCNLKAVPAQRHRQARAGRIFLEPNGHRLWLSGSATIPGGPADPAAGYGHGQRLGQVRRRSNTGGAARRAGAFSASGAGQKATNASVFVAQWRSHMAYTAQFSLLSDAVGRELEIEKHLGGYGHEALADVN